MKRTTLFASIFLVLIAATFQCLAQPDLPKVYEGAFHWLGSEDESTVSLFLVDIRRDRKGNIIAKGKGIYSGQTKIDIKIWIRIDDHRFQMWETNPEGVEGFVTEGSHIGVISPDFRRIEAIWTTKGAGNKGILKLYAKIEEADPA